MISATPASSDGNAKLSILFVRLSTVASIAVGILALVGWKFDLQFFIRLHPGLASMKTVSAVSFILIASSLWCLSYESRSKWKNGVGILLAYLSTLCGLVILTESALNLDFGVDNLIAKAMGSSAALATSQRPPVIAAACIALLGIALLLLGRKVCSFYPSQILALLSGLVGTAGLVGYALNAKEFYSIPGFASTSLQTATTIVALSLGVLFARPSEGFVAALNHDTADGRLARRLLPCAVLIPILFAWLRLKGQLLGLYGTEVGLILYATANIACLLVFVYISVDQLGRALSTARRVEDRFKRLVEAAPDAMVIVNERGRIVLINTQTQKLFGYTRDELLGQAIEVLVPQKSRGRHSEHRTKFVHNSLVRPMGAGLELYGLRKDGTEFPVEVSLSPLETEEGLLVSSAVRDITDRKRFERTLQEKNVELEKANRAKDRFLATMSHELRTPLNAIIGFTGTLLMKLPGPLTSEQEKQLRTIQSSGRHLLSLINDLLDLAKIESGKVQVQIEPVACQPILEEIATALRPQAEAKGLEFELSMPHPRVVVMADRRALKQILLNLTSNAIKFTERGLVRLELAEHIDDEMCAEISVTDTGVGIGHEDQAKLFKAFARVETDKTRHLEGTGLGLHLSQRLAELLQARITLESAPGRGSRFAVMLSRQPPQSQLHEQETADAHG
jgi:PAS domain S-box-containing protein